MRNNRMYTVKELKNLPTLHSGQFDNLKVESKVERVWLSRMTIEDGAVANNIITIEKLKEEGWIRNSYKEVRGRLVEVEVDY